MRQEAIVWALLPQQVDVSSLQDFLEEFPNGVHAGEAKSKLTELERQAEVAREEEKHRRRETEAWELLAQQVDISSLQGFLDEFPNSIHAAEAKSKLKELVAREEEERWRRETEAWALLSQRLDASSLRSFLEEFPNGVHAAEAKSKLTKLSAREEERWKREMKALELLTPQVNASSVRAFLGDFPNGVYAEEAKALLTNLEGQAQAAPESRRRETEAWELLPHQVDVSSLQGFLEEFPNGIHAREAKSKLMELERLGEAARHAEESHRREAEAWASTSATSNVRSSKPF